MLLINYHEFCATLLIVTSLSWSVESGSGAGSVRVAYDDDVIREANDRARPNYPAPSQEHSLENLLRNINQFYEGCNTHDKVCTGLFTENCVEKKSCTLAASVRENDTHFELELLNRVTPRLQPDGKATDIIPSNFYLAIAYPTSGELKIRGAYACRNPTLSDFKFVMLWNRPVIEKPYRGYYTYRAVARKEYWRYQCHEELLDQGEDNQDQITNFDLTQAIKDRSNFFAIGGYEKKTLANGTVVQMNARFLEEEVYNAKTSDGILYTNVQPVRGPIPSIMIDEVGMDPNINYLSEKEISEIGNLKIESATDHAVILRMSHITISLLSFSMLYFLN